MVWEIQGTEGSLRIETATGYVHFGDLAITCRVGRQPPQRLPVPVRYTNDEPGLGVAAQGVARLYAQLASDLRDGGRTAPDFQVALARHRVLDAIAKASETGQRQSVAPVRRQT